MIIKNIKASIAQLMKFILFKLSASNSLAFIAYCKWIYAPKPQTVEAFIDQISNGQKRFFVIQVGANDGITHDPLHRFIKRDNWQGLLLEPQPWVFAQKLVPIYTRNKEIVPINAAVGYESGETDLFQLSFSNQRWATGLARFDRSSLEALIANGNIERRAKKNGITLPPNKSDWIKSVRIKVMSPAELIKKYNVELIDLLMIDAEGFDFEIVKMFLAENPKPMALAFESFHFDKSVQDECSLLLEKHGYRFKTAGPNTLAWQKPLDHLVQD
jgi:FkbM family methyltransferase